MENIHLIEKMQQQIANQEKDIQDLHKIIKKILEEQNKTFKHIYDKLNEIDTE